MPVSRNRKQHGKKLQQRKEQIIFRKRLINKMYTEMYQQLQDKSESVVEMLNKEESISEPATSGYVEVDESSYQETPKDDDKNT